MNDRHDVLMTILCLANCLSRELDALIAVQGGAGISSVNAQILRYLAEHEGRDVFQRDIEEAFSIRRSTVSKIVGLMESKGLVEREAVDRDARLKRLKLTDKARGIHAIASDKIATFEAQATEELSAQDVELLKRLLDRIGASLQNKLQ